MKVSWEFAVSSNLRHADAHLRRRLTHHGEFPGGVFMTAVGILVVSHILVLPPTNQTNDGESIFALA